MAFRSFYDDINQYAQPERETPESMQPGYTSPEIRAMGAQRWKPRLGTSIDTGIPWRNVVGTTPEGAQINVHPSVMPSIPVVGPAGMTKQIPTPSSSQATQPTAPKVTPFLWNMMSSMRDMDVDARGEYLQTVAAGIKDKLDSFAMRLARGIPLTPEQNKRYMSLRDAFNDIQRYSTNQSAYDEYLGAFNKTGGASAPAEYEAWRTGQYRG